MKLYWVFGGATALLAGLAVFWLQLLSPNAPIWLIAPFVGWFAGTAAGKLWTWSRR